MTYRSLGSIYLVWGAYYVGVFLSNSNCMKCGSNEYRQRWQINPVSQYNLKVAEKYGDILILLHYISSVITRAGKAGLTCQVIAWPLLWNLNHMASSNRIVWLLFSRILLKPCGQSNWQTDSLAGYRNLRSFNSMPNFEATLSGFPSTPKHANQLMNFL